MPKPLNREKLKAFIQRRRINALGLAVITAASAVITLVCALTGFPHTDILVIVTVLLVVLCVVQLLKYRRRFRTIHKGLRVRKKHRTGSEKKG